MVLLSELDLSAQDILEELADRFGIGGIKEKTERE
jgi:phosphoribosyl-ATP pyrophosphohydrolase